MCPRTVRYFQAGGATDRKWSFYVYTKILFKVPEITTSAYRDLSAIMEGVFYPGVLEVISSLPLPYSSPLPGFIGIVRPRKRCKYLIFQEHLTGVYHKPKETSSLRKLV